MDLEWLGDEEWRCRNCDAILSEGAELLHHRHRDCRHPQSESRAVARESTCVGCRAALAQVRALREPAMAAVTAPAAAAAAADDDAGGVTTGGARRGGRTRAVGRGRGVVGPHGEVLMWAEGRVGVLRGVLSQFIYQYLII